jgi:hypothetical protein
VKKPESPAAVAPPTLSKTQATRPKLTLAPNETFTRAVNETNLGRRRVPRRAFDSPIGLLACGKYLIERSYQVGEGGMMISSQRPLAVDQMVVISFYLGQVTIVVRGTVRSVVPPGKGFPERYGVEFANLGFQFKREIRNFVASATGVDA